jgi:hypothetical protein
MKHVIGYFKKLFRRKKKAPLKDKLWAAIFRTLNDKD